MIIKTRSEKRHELKSRLLIAAVFILFTAGIIILIPALMWHAEVEQAAQEYDELRERVEIVSPDNPVTDNPLVVQTPDTFSPLLIPLWEQAETGDAPDSPPDETDSSAAPATVSGSGSGVQKKTSVDLAALKAENGDFIAWLQIPGTAVNYPVVLTDNIEYYLSHTISGKESSSGTLLSLGKTDYSTPGKNIAIYGHHLRSSPKKMFGPLLSYKKKSFYSAHPTIYLDTLYFSGTYTIFAVLNMTNGTWDAAEADFADDRTFLDFVNRAKAQSMYDTGIEVHADDQVLTLITCDRDFGGKDGRLVVMAVRQ